ncbi:hypothetical protein D9M70_322930 [compost metagenome]
MEAYTFQRTDLASRPLAAIERASISELLSHEENVVIDLENVESISESFADELFGVLVLERGLSYVLQHIKLVNAAEDVLRSIAIAMKRRSLAVA